MAVKEGHMTITALPQVRVKTGIASPEDYAACRQIMRTASKNYSFSSNFLPPDKLHHVEALYALFRVGDDRVDVSHDGFESPLAAIEDWERTYRCAFEVGDSPNPVMRAYLNTALECGIPRETMSAYFRAMKDDLTITRFPTFDDLMYYMEGSAIPVGRGMTYILGARAPYTLDDALPGADSLSVAMQLSNFWRDIGQDFKDIGRVYLPQEDMARFNVTEEHLAAQRINSNFIKLLEFEFERTERYYAHARESVKMLAAGRWGIMSSLEIYRSILFAIRRNGYDVFTRRARTSKLQKLGLVARARWQVMRRSP
jgi:phytoene synthase